MIALNSDSILVGQIKQLLHNFNLPQCQIGRNNPQPNYHFIEDDDMYYWDENLKPHWVSKYLYGERYLNITSVLKIQNMIYDRPTHRYLGKYLRFLREYNHIDLMSMYNCLDKESVYHDIAVELKNKKIINFNKNDTTFVSYQVPISYNVDLSLFLQSLQTYEVCLYPCPQSQNLINDEAARQELAAATYKKIRSSDVIYYNPVEIALNYIEQLSDGVETDLTANVELIKTTQTQYKNFLLKNWDNLYILIKIPKANKNSMVVLEGKYTVKNYKDSQYIRYQPCADPNLTDPKKIEQAIKLVNPIKAIERFNEEQLVTEKDAEDGPYYFSYLADSGFNISAQLLSYENLSGNYLLADRLVEYLTNNATNPLSIPAEIKRLQLALDTSRDRYSSAQIFYVQNNENDPLAFYVQSTAESGTVEPISFYVATNVSINTYNPADRKYGIWNYLDEQDLKSLKNYMRLNLEYDTLGYLDKDIENAIKADLDNVSV